MTFVSPIRRLLPFKSSEVHCCLLCYWFIIGIWKVNSMSNIECSFSVCLRDEKEAFSADDRLRCHSSGSLSSVERIERVGRKNKGLCRQCHQSRGLLKDHLKSNLPRQGFRLHLATSGRTSPFGPLFLLISLTQGLELSPTNTFEYLEHSTLKWSRI